MKTRIYYHHTDCGGVVYYATYLTFLEEARTEFLAARGIDIPELMGKNTFFVVSRQEVDYRSPAKYGDDLEVTTELAGFSAVRIDLRHEIYNQKKTLICQARTVCALIGADFRPMAIPKEIKEKLQSCLTGKK